ncbi:tetratricopeptide repeat protein [Candidatus Woesearchaeota archaeon]|nr:tetratricopeptide repeat protein [Candidatus Woesearchaeota archaeon]
MEAGNEKKAIQCFKKALEMDEEYVDAYSGLGSVAPQNLTVPRPLIPILARLESENRQLSTRLRT